jgi:hypothetical protein
LSSQLCALCSQFLALIERKIHAKCQSNFKKYEIHVHEYLHKMHLHYQLMQQSEI